jgi:phage tail sheath protein FI
MFGITPKLIGAPSLIADKDVAKSLQDVGDGLTAVCFYDLASTTVEAAINEAKNSGLSDRSVACWPAGCIDKDRKIKLGLSAWALARYAKTDIETGWHVSGSNKKLFKLWGLEHPIGWAVTDKSSEAARLNNANIVTAINYEGWRLWGNRSVATGDGDRGFIAVRRTADFIGEAIIKAHIDLLDSPINRSFVGLVLSRCNSLMRDLKNQEKILGGEVWIDPERNSTDSVRTGKLVYQYRFTPNYPCEELTFEQSITYEWISEIFK